MDISNGLLFFPRALLSRKIRGGNRLTQFLAKHFRSLRSHRVAVPGGLLFVDLRWTGAQGYIHDIAENEEHRTIKRCVRAGDVVYDIGANAGLYTVWLSFLVGTSGKVFSFEPNPFHSVGLARTAELLKNADVLNVGLSDYNGERDLFIPENDTMASLTDWTSGKAGRVQKEKCMVTTIDTLINQGRILQPHFIKCDIEGGEVDCFRGAAKVLNSHDAPVILFEANINSTGGFGNTISSGMDFLAGLDKPEYKFFLVNDDSSLRPIDSIDFLHGNILAVPASRSELIAGPDA